MKSIFVTLCLLGGLSAKPVSELTAVTPATITHYERQDLPDNGWHFYYEQSDGQKREETGRFKNPGTDDEILEQKGWYSYIGDDGETYKVDYIADENGFVPSGEHLHSINAAKKLLKL